MNKLKKIRKKLKLTQFEFGQLLNVSEGLISKYESGSRHPSYNKIREIKKILGLKYDDIID